MNTDEISYDRPAPNVIAIIQPSVLDKLMFSPHKKMLYPRLAQMLLSMNVVESFTFSKNVFNEIVALSTFHQGDNEHYISWSINDSGSYFMFESSQFFPLSFEDLCDKLLGIYTCVLEFTRERGRKAQNAKVLNSLLPKDIVAKVAEFVEDKELPALYKKALGHVKFAWPEISVRSP